MDIGSDIAAAILYAISLLIYECTRAARNRGGGRAIRQWSREQQLTLPGQGVAKTRQRNNISPLTARVRTELYIIKPLPGFIGYLWVRELGELKRV